MVIKPEIACGILEGIAAVRDDEDLQDFVVEVEATDYKCHRLILSACSGFFRGLLQSGMKEAKKQKTKLRGVSKETFEDILNTLYTGNDVLTKRNMLNVWLAADLLQIKLICAECVNFIINNISCENVIAVWQVASELQNTVVIEKCELFIKSNVTIENCKEFYTNAKHFNSDFIISHIQEVIRKNFDKAIQSDVFLCLSESELLDMVDSQDLVVSSEDVVIDSILKWINLDPLIAQNKQSGKSTAWTNLAESENQQVKVAADVTNRNQIEAPCGVISVAPNQHDVGVGDGHPGQQRINCRAASNDKRSSPGRKTRKSSSSSLIIEGETEYLNHGRMKCLARLLSATRLCLVSPECLERLSREKMVIHCQESREMVMQAALYKSVGRRHGHFPKAAIHRSCSELENVGVMGQEGGTFYALSCHEDFKWLKIPDCPFLNSCVCLLLISYSNDVYALGTFVNGKCCLCVFAKNMWQKVTSLVGGGWLGIAHGEFIYLFNSLNQQVKRLDPRFGNNSIVDISVLPAACAIEHTCTFDVFILIFCSEVSNGVELTTVYSLDTRSLTWSKLDNMEGPAKHMVSFRKEKTLYVLQENGRLSEICRDEGGGVKVNFTEALWDFRYKLFGAIAFVDKLFIYGEDKTIRSDERNWQETSKSFSSITSVGDTGSWSNIIPAVISKVVMKPV